MIGMFVIDKATFERAESLAALCADGTTAADVIEAAIVEYGERMTGEEEAAIERDRTATIRTSGPR